MPPGCTPPSLPTGPPPRLPRLAETLALRAAIQAAPRPGAHRINLLLKRAALPDWQRYGTHSQRRGAAIELRRRGASDFEIARPAVDVWIRCAVSPRSRRIPDIWDDPEAGRLGR